MRRQRASDHEIAAIAARHGGVVAREELRELGLSAAAVDHRVRAGRLHALHRGVYAVGHRVVPAEGRWWAAVRACGDDAVLSHASAAAAWDVRRTAGAVVDVTVPGASGRRRRDGIRLHRSQTLCPDDVTVRREIPITTPLRTVLDLAASGLRDRPLERVLDRAELLGLVDFADLRRRIDAHPARPGSPSLDALLSRYTAGAFVTRSELEEAFLALCDDFGLPRPDVNRVIEGKEVDFLWRPARLVVEVDGYAWHRSPSAMEVDRERDVVLSLAAP
jgi:Transcriptional regulator, AbiEi antitoxin